MIKKLFYGVAVLVALLAATIGIVGNVSPHLFLKIPNFGFILWAMTGHPLPPYFSPDAWKTEEMATWAKDKDVVVATGAKSGTTWMLYCSHQIRTKGSDAYDFTDVSYSTPWLDYIQNPGSSWAEQKSLMETTIVPATGKPLGHYWNHKDYPFRIFKSHYTPAETGGELPTRQFPNVKFLAMTRNPFDVVASFVPFFDSHNEEFRSTWGGFPPASTGNLEADTEARINELLPGGLLQDLYFTYVNRWWPLRNDANILLLHYSDAKKDLKGTVQKIADFYEVELSPDELDSVTEKCTLSHMKSRGDIFLYDSPLNPNLKGKIMRSGALTRNGRIGDGLEALTADQRARFSKAADEQFADPQLRKWAFEGGEYE